MNARTPTRAHRVRESKTNRPASRTCPRIDAGRPATRCLRCLLPGALETFYGTYNHRRYVHPDPLEFLYEYRDLCDREVVGLVASSLAFGRVAQILSSVRTVLDRMGPSPHGFLVDSSLASLRRTFDGFIHRYVTGRELALTLYGVRQAILRYGSIEGCLAACIAGDLPCVSGVLHPFMQELLVDIEEDGKVLIPDPAGRSACKRVNLFLRWMIRRDDVDPGGWKAVSPRALLVPLDTHMHRIGLALGFTARKSADLQTAIEITDGFRRIRPDDPVRYDFALTRLPIRDRLSLADRIAPTAP